MLTLTRSGSMAGVIAQVRSIPGRVIPYAASTALTRVAQAGQQAIIAAMPRVFDRPTPYTLGATRIVPSTVQTLSARVAVKDQARGGNVPEHYLVPEVFGGSRKEKAFEKALRYAGVLQSGERAILGRRAPVDAFGNLQRSSLAQVLAVTGARAGARRASRARLAERRQYFAGTVAGQRGVWKREGRAVSAMIIFTRKPPQYRARLDFAGIVQPVVEANYEREFLAAADAILQRRAG